MNDPPPPPPRATPMESGVPNYARSPPPVLGPLSQENIYPLSRVLVILAIAKIPHFPDFLGKCSRDYAPNSTPIPKKNNANTHAAPLCIRGGGGAARRHTSNAFSASLRHPTDDGVVDNHDDVDDE